MITNYWKVGVTCHEFGLKKCHSFIKEMIMEVKRPYLTFMKAILRRENLLKIMTNKTSKLTLLNLNIKRVFQLSFS